jgi:uncharacterized damage-inducible protein DinB
MGERIDELVARLRKGIRKTAEIFSGLNDEQWRKVLYTEPPTWTVRDLLAHFLSAEEGLLRIMQNVAAGGPGAPEDFDYNAYNADEQARLAGIAPQTLLTDLAVARETTIAWVTGLDEADLERTGRHPALGEVTLEVFINGIYGHQLMHMRDLQTLLQLKT